MNAEGLGELTVSMKDILKGLRELKRFTPLAFEMLKVLCEGQESSAVSIFNISFFIFVSERFNTLVLDDPFIHVVLLLIPMKRKHMFFVL